MLVFPTWRFPFKSKDFDIDLSTISGGVALNGSEDMIATDGGGSWSADLGSADLYTRDRVMLWRAFKSALHGGIDPFVFPACDARHQPRAPSVLVPHSDGSPFSDATLYSGADGALTAGAALRATQIAISHSLAEPLIGGERFTIVHATMKDRCYQIGRILAQDSTSATIQFHPPLREATEADTSIDFTNPRCVMHLDGAMRAPLAGPRWATGSVRFVEDFSGSYV
ncbi:MULTISPECIES: hypothetical protein [unclassified Sphingomonas]|uniref:hypothetical protein n=1 Tax=unclassified Sphingomonas TaxID=196159 RepID=UPI0006FD8C99|nr:MULTISPECIES: hypothetical protein [unclassified Sphingomonas]KQX18427.1 hypothetical protein ASD17_14795 [Sphingomonas sp. Root1294]KQY72248.1 hypothetical protein ASD39_20180 [Sphingomonas sp. Root50]KRB94481.1 hypothetical protein ASE22_00570 [Sphingomonas sp. Root720]